MVCTLPESIIDQTKNGLLYEILNMPLIVSTTSDFSERHNIHNRRVYFHRGVEYKRPTSTLISDLAAACVDRKTSFAEQSLKNLSESRSALASSLLHYAILYGFIAPIDTHTRHRGGKETRSYCGLLFNPRREQIFHYTVSHTPHSKH